MNKPNNLKTPSTYASPEVKAFDVRANGVLCTSDYGDAGDAGKQGVVRRDRTDF